MRQTVHSYAFSSPSVKTRSPDKPSSLKKEGTEESSQSLTDGRAIEAASHLQGASPPTRFYGCFSYEGFLSAPPINHFLGGDLRFKN